MSEQFYQVLNNIRDYFLNYEFILRISLSMISFLGIILLFSAFRRFLHVIIQKNPKLGENQFYYHKALNIIMYFCALLFIISIWGKNPWGFFVGIIGIGAIAFFAVWSILSNILAGLLTILTSPFRVGDTINIVSENIEGQVHDYGLLFLRLKDKDGNIISVPHNLIFQKIIITKTN